MPCRGLFLLIFGMAVVALGFQHAAVRDAHAVSLVTSDQAMVDAFVAGAPPPLGFDNVPGNNFSPGSAVDSQNAIDDEFKSFGVLFSSTGGPAVAVNFPSDAKSGTNLLGGTQQGGPGAIVVDYLQPINVDIVQPGTTTPDTTSLVGAWLDPTGSIVRLEVFDGANQSIENAQGSQGQFVGIKAAGIAHARFSFVQAQTVSGFTIDDLFVIRPTPTPTPTVTPTPPVTATPSPTPTAASAALGHFMIYKAQTTKGTAKFLKFGPVTLADAFGSGSYDVLKPTGLAAPANKNGEGFTDAATHLALYAVKPAKGSPKFPKRLDVHVANQCGEVFVTVTKPVSLFLPTAKDLINPVPALNESDHNVDHFLCYKAKAEKKRADGMAIAPFPKKVQVDVTDQFQTRRYDLKKVVQLCATVSKSGRPVLLAGPDKGAAVAITPATIRNPASHLLCYQATLAKKLIAQNGCGPASPTDKGTTIAPPQAKHVARLGMHVANQFGPGRLDTKKEALLCVPSTLP